MAKNTVIETGAEKEKALLIAIQHQHSGNREEVQQSIDELERLAESAGAVVIQKIIQHLVNPRPDSYVGKGKLQELAALKKELDYNLVILDDELTPNQQKVLEETLEVKVIDRAALILDIFAQRARTREGRLQVELAQHEYLLPRLAGQWSHLERLGGGIGTRGPGESQLETDRRIIKHKIQRLKNELEIVRRSRALHRRHRQRTGVPVVAMVGYTNTGKSTLLNALCKTDIYADDRLFATLDPTARRLILPDNRNIIITDTVGFIRKLPPTIIEAFRATLEELDDATMLLHVVDLSSGDAAEQCHTVEKILHDLHLDNKPRITVLNKIDLFLEKAEDKTIAESEAKAIEFFDTQEKLQLGLSDRNTTGPVIYVSATRRWGFDRLLKVIAEQLPLQDNMAEFSSNI